MNITKTMQVGGGLIFSLVSAVFFAIIYRNRRMSLITDSLMSKIPIISVMDRNSEIKKAVGRRIKELRKERNITQTQFALMASVSRSYLAEVELGEKNFGFNTLVKIVDAFDMTLEQFFTGIR